jgi:hypothetical protein
MPHRDGNDGWVLDVLSSGTEGTGPCLVLSLEKKTLLGGEYKPMQRIVFNACESFQRLCKERKVKLAKVDRCYLTATQPSHLMGLPGLILGLSSIGAASLAIQGPHGTEHFVRATGPFVRRKWPVVQVTDLLTSSSPNPNVQGQGQEQEQEQQEDGPKFETIYENEALQLSYFAVPRLLERQQDNDLQPFQPSRKRQRVSQHRDSTTKTTTGRNVDNDGLTPPVFYKCVLSWKNQTSTVYIVDCPHLCWVDSVAALSLSTSSTPTVIDLSPSNVLSDPQYQQWSSQ